MPLLWHIYYLCKRSTIISAFNLRADGGRTPLQILCDYLCEKKALLILDNCEHLIDACEKLAESLLSTASALKILATSREALGVNGEAAWVVPSLSLPDIKNLPQVEQLSQYEAVQLFTERARLVQPHFNLTRDNARAVVQICYRLDGIPLAIELAAARIKMMTAEQINDHLDDRFHLLTNGSRTALPRHQTLQGTIDWSYNLLSEQEKLLLQRLTVFVGGWTLEAAEHVCIDGKIDKLVILNLLTHLIDKSLVIVKEQGEDTRYYILETVRQYAHEKLLENVDNESIQNQHTKYFLAWAEAAAPFLSGTKDQAKWLGRFEIDYGNLRKALNWFYKMGNREDVGRLSLALWRFWLEHDYFDEGVQWLEIVLERPNEISTLVCSDALSLMGWLLHFQGKYEQACIVGIEGLMLSRELDNRQGVFSALCVLGMVARYRASTDAEYTHAQALFGEALVIARELNDSWCIALSGLLTAAVAFHLGDSAQARVLLEESLARFEKSDNRLEIAQTHGLLGLVEFYCGNFSLARAQYLEGLTICRELGSKQASGEMMWGLAGISFFQGNLNDARSKFEEGLKLFLQVNDRQSIARCLEGLAGVTTMQGQAERGAQIFGGADALRQVIGAGIGGRYRGAYDKVVGLTRASLEESVFAIAWAKGRTMNLEQTIEYALQVE